MKFTNFTNSIKEESARQLMGCRYSKTRLSDGAVKFLKHKPAKKPGLSRYIIFDHELNQEV